MIVKAYAKINIALNVVNKREDGYHELDMVMVPLDLHDSLDIDIVPPSFDTLVTCDDYDLINEDYNLATIAINKMRQFYGFKESFRVHIHKRIPMSAGLGGGSSDSAAVIRGIVSLLKLKVKDSDIIQICRSIGSDVPFFYEQIPARVRGTGETLLPLKVKKQYYVLLIKPKQGLSTKTVFETYDKDPTVPRDINPVIKALETGDDGLLEVSIFNQLEKAAMSLCNDVTIIKEELKKDGMNIVAMSGSGSAVYALHDQVRKLEKIAHKYVKLGHKVLLTQFRLKEGKVI